MRVVERDEEESSGSRLPLTGTAKEDNTTLAGERERQQVVCREGRDFAQRAQGRVADRRVLNCDVNRSRHETVTAEKRVLVGCT